MNQQEIQEINESPKDDYLRYLSDVFASVSEKERHETNKLINRIFISVNVIVSLILIYLLFAGQTTKVSTPSFVSSDSTEYFRAKTVFLENVVVSVSNELSSTKIKNDSLKIESAFKRTAYVASSSIKLSIGDTLSNRIDPKSQGFDLFERVAIVLDKIEQNRVDITVVDKISADSYVATLTPEKRLFSRFSSKSAVSIYLQEINISDSSVIIVPRIKSNL